MSFSTPAIQSLQAIETWVGLIDAEMAGLGRTAFKATRPTLVGLTAQAPGSVLRPPAACLTVTAGIDFAQGPILPSSSPLHLALDGPGFFPVVPAAAEGPLCYTRDGEFRLVPDPKGGYCLMNGLGMRLFIPPPRSVLARVESPDPGRFDPARLGLDGMAEPLQVAHFADPAGALHFACYGATVFQPTPAAAPPVFGALAAGTDGQVAGLPTRVRTGALEGSNVAVGRLIPDLSLAQKLFSALAQLIAADERRFHTLVDELR